MNQQREHHHPRLFDDQRWAVGGAVALYALAAIVMIWMALGRSTLQPLDDWFHDAMIDLENGVLTFGAQVLNYAGSVWVTAPLRLAIVGLLWARKRWEWLTVWMASIVVAEISVTVFKLLYDRPRPLDPLVSTTGASFPSGHAVAGAVTAVALVIVFLPSGPHRRIWELVAVGFAFFMAMSRTYLRAHWLTDVVAGTLLGAAAAVGVAAVVHVWWLRNRGAREVPLRA
ncbi:MAG: phosphatase PAP2 family protein [Acidimicrobiia bacterium]|jgi:undecaprenyl-diphosphatase|nr:phosphatase PAP2 family protein [Acidimicrobiia bacterium]